MYIEYTWREAQVHVNTIFFNVGSFGSNVILSNAFKIFDFPYD